MVKLESVGVKPVCTTASSVENLTKEIISRRDFRFRICFFNISTNYLSRFQVLRYKTAPLGRRIKNRFKGRNQSHSKSRNLGLYLGSITVPKSGFLIRLCNRVKIRVNI